MKRFLIVAVFGTVVVALLWKLLLTLGVTYTAARYLHKQTAGSGKRRRPKASWPKIIEAVSLATVAWNVRHINGGRAKVTPGFTLGLGRRLRRNEAESV
jgi:hypothetical protein